MHLIPGSVVLASRNRHKVIEVGRILAERVPALVVVGLDDVAPDLPDIAETGSTFAENALIKARAVAVATGMAALSDDSGLCVDVLNGMPGIRSARWAGRHGDDHANLELLLAQIDDVPDGQRGAQFVCAAAYASPDGAELVAEGILAGSLARARRGANGFGYDPIFVPIDDSRTTAEMAPAEKDVISHRGRAFRALADLLVTPPAPGTG
jgi:XTP/dITP diphosphohydrolase